MNRPAPITTLGKYLALVGVSAIGGLVAFLRPGFLEGFEDMARFDANVTTRLLAVAAGIYAIATLVASFAILKLRPWAPRAYLVFVASIVYYIVQFMFLIRIEAPWPLGLAFFAVLAGLLLWGWKILIRHAAGGIHNAL